MAEAIPGANAGDIPGPIRLTLAHAAVQVIAADLGIDLLHVKGEALDPAVRRAGRMSTDVDVLVRPSAITSLLGAVDRHGWVLIGNFATSSPFEHSATLLHPVWGYLDVHRIYPGLELPAAAAFDVLWERRGEWSAGGVVCPVPDVAAQRLLLLLHAARSAGSDRARADVDHVWGAVPEDGRGEIRRLADRLGANVALAAATGTLADWADDPAHDLWHVSALGGSRVEEWAARIRATPTLRGKVRLLLRAPLVNVDHLAMTRGHRPTRREVVGEFFARPVRGAREEWARRRRPPPA